MKGTKLDVTDTVAVSDAVWRRTLAVYASDGVKEACLGLQTRYGIGVSALFALLSLKTLGIHVPGGKALDVVLSRANDWQHRVIEPLRCARRAARLESSVASAEEVEDAEQFRAALMQQEIASERLQQRLLIADCLARPKGLDQGAQVADLANLADVAERYLRRFCDEPTSADQSALAAITAAFAD